MKYVKRFLAVFFRFVGGSVLAYGVCLLFVMFSGMSISGASGEFIRCFWSVGFPTDVIRAPWMNAVFILLWLSAFVFQIYLFSVSSSSKGSCYDYLSLTAGKPYSYLRDAKLFWKEEGGPTAVASLLWSFFSFAFDYLPFSFFLRAIGVFLIYRFFYFFSRLLWSLDRTGGIDGDPSTPE